MNERDKIVKYSNSLLSLLGSHLIQAKINLGPYYESWYSKHGEL